MAAQRNTQPRKQIGEHKVDEFEYPFNSCYIPEEGLDTDGYGCEIEVRHIPHVESKPSGDFPYNVKRWIWSSPGEKDELPWDCIVELEERIASYHTEEQKDEKKTLNDGGKRYAYFHAWCDYTGFDCQGGAYVIVVDDISKLIEFGLGNATYNRYIEGTQPAEEW